MKYLAVRVRGDIVVLNNGDELGGLYDLGIEHEVIGTVCDDKEFGDMCSTNCRRYYTETCPAEIVTDFMGNKWHVLK